jgi:membrane protein required for colicin V production
MISFDIFAFTIIGLSVLYSVWKGMVREAFSLVALVVAYLVALNLYSDFAVLIGGVITEETLANILSFIILFVLSLLLVAVLGRMATKYLHSTHTISGWDRFLGGFFGMAKGIFLVIVFMFPLQWFDETYARWTEDSLVAPYLEEWVDDIRGNVELGPGFNRSMPGSLKGMRRQMPNIKGINESLAEQKETLQEKTSSLTQLDSPPQDDYTKKDRESLDKILNEISNNSNNKKK